MDDECLQEDQQFSISYPSSESSSSSNQSGSVQDVSWFTEANHVPTDVKTSVDELEDDSVDMEIG